MNDIKVGQVYKDKNDGLNFVVSYILGEQATSVIYNNGSLNDLLDSKYIELFGQLLATYPFWQEAVNSKEFKGE